MANLNRIIYLTEAQKDTLFSEGSVTSNGTTIIYNPNDLYITSDDTVALPPVTSDDNGKILMVVNGVWTAVLPNS